MANWDDLLNLPIESARKKAKSYGYVLRVTSHNDQPGLGTADYREDRLNISTKTVAGRDLVVAIKGVG